MYTFKYVVTGPSDWHMVLFPLNGCTGEDHLDWRQRIKNDSRVVNYEFDTQFTGPNLVGTLETWTFNSRDDAIGFRNDMETTDQTVNRHRPYTCTYNQAVQNTIDCGCHLIESLIAPDGTIEILLDTASM